MTYTLKESGNIVGGQAFESFWLFVRFQVNQQTQMLQIQRGGSYFAFYGSYTSAHRSLDLPEFGDDPAKVQTKNYELMGKNDLKLQLNSLSLQDSRCADLSGESSQLHLFRFLPTADQEPTTWLDDGGWNATFENRVANANPDHPFVKHEVSFGDCSGRDCYWTLSRDTQLGTNRFGLAVPFLKGSLISNLLKNDGKECPKIEINVNDQKWAALDAKPLPGDPTGYAMVCSGVFKEISLSSQIEAWHKVTSGAPAPHQILDHLSEVAERRGRGDRDREQLLTRTLQTAHVTDDNSVVQEDSRHPVEVLYVDLALQKSMPRLITYK